MLDEVKNSKSYKTMISKLVILQEFPIDRYNIFRIPI